MEALLSFFLLSFFFLLVWKFSLEVLFVRRRRRFESAQRKIFLQSATCRPTSKVNKRIRDIFDLPVNNEKTKMISPSSKKSPLNRHLFSIAIVSFIVIAICCLNVVFGHSGNQVEEKEDHMSFQRSIRRPPRSSPLLASFKRPELDVFISVKTSEKFHEKRLDVILRTWFKLAPKEVRNC